MGAEDDGHVADDERVGREGELAARDALLREELDRDAAATELVGDLAHLGGEAAVAFFLDEGEADHGAALPIVARVAAW